MNSEEERILQIIGAMRPGYAPGPRLSQNVEVGARLNPWQEFMANVGLHMTGGGKDGPSDHERLSATNPPSVVKQIEEAIRTRSIVPYDPMLPGPKAAGGPVHRLTDAPKPPTGDWFDDLSLSRTYDANEALFLNNIDSPWSAWAPWVDGGSAAHISRMPEINPEAIHTDSVTRTRDAYAKGGKAMPLLKGSSNIGRNIAELSSSGKRSHAQNVAIALHVAGQGRPQKAKGGEVEPPTDPALYDIDQTPIQSYLRRRAVEEPLGNIATGVAGSALFGIGLGGYRGLKETAYGPKGPGGWTKPAGAPPGRLGTGIMGILMGLGGGAMLKALRDQYNSPDYLGAAKKFDETGLPGYPSRQEEIDFHLNKAGGGSVRQGYAEGGAPTNSFDEFAPTHDSGARFAALIKSLGLATAKSVAPPIPGFNTQPYEDYMADRAAEQGRRAPMSGWEKTKDVAKDFGREGLQRASSALHAPVGAVSKLGELGMFFGPSLANAAPSVADIISHLVSPAAAQEAGAPKLYSGEKRPAPEIRAIQKMLKDKGYDVTVDGVDKGATRQAEFEDAKKQYNEDRALKLKESEAWARATETKTAAEKSAGEQAAAERAATERTAGLHRLEDVEKDPSNKPWISPNTGYLIGGGLGLGLGYGVGKLFQRNARTAMDAANVLMANAGKGKLADRAANVNEFYTKGGAEIPPFLPNPGKMPAVKPNPKAPAGTGDLYPAPSSKPEWITQGLFAGSGVTESGVASWMVTKAEAEKEKAAAELAKTPNEATISRFLDARNSANNWEVAANAGRGFAGGQFLGAKLGMLGRPPYRPDVQTAEGERFKLDEAITKKKASVKDVESKLAAEKADKARQKAERAEARKAKGNGKVPGALGVAGGLLLPSPTGEQAEAAPPLGSELALDDTSDQHHSYYQPRDEVGRYRGGPVYPKKDIAASSTLSKANGGRTDKDIPAVSDAVRLAHEYANGGRARFDKGGDVSASRDPWLENARRPEEGWGAFAARQYDPIFLGVAQALTAGRPRGAQTSLNDAVMANRLEKQMPREEPYLQYGEEHLGKPVDPGITGPRSWASMPRMRDPKAPDTLNHILAWDDPVTPQLMRESNYWPTANSNAPGNVYSNSALNPAQMQKFLNALEGRKAPSPFEVIPGDKKAHGGSVPGHDPHVVGPVEGRTGGRADKIPVSVPSGAYVLPADFVSGLPNAGGNTAAGMAMLEKTFGKSNPHAMASGGAVPIAISHGEFVLGPDQVAKIGGGSLDQGHRILDAMVKKVRADHIKTLKSLPPPSR